jgi:NADH dehydrogenase
MCNGQPQGHSGTGEGITPADGCFIASELVVWAAGVKAPAVLRESDGLEINRTNQLVVGPTLQTTHDPAAFAIGDCAACPWLGSLTPVPPRAQAAHQQASHMARQIERQMHGKKLLPDTYHDFGSLVSLGKWSTVGSPMGFLFGRGFFVEGLFAQIMYRSLRATHDQAVGGTTQALLGNFVRGLANCAGPRVKLH